MPVKQLDEIVKSCQKGKSSAQKQMYDALSGKMYAVCLRYCKDRTEAEDCLQEGFIKVFNNIGKFKFNGSFEGWVRRIIVNTVIEVYRKKRPEVLVDEFPILTDENEVNAFDVGLSQDELMEMIQQLPPRYKIVFNLYVLDGFSHAEIAETIGISIGTSKSNLARARKWLKENIQSKVFERKQEVC